MYPSHAYPPPGYGAGGAYPGGMPPATPLYVDQFDPRRKQELVTKVLSRNLSFLTEQDKRGYNLRFYGMLIGLSAVVGMIPYSIYSLRQIRMYPALRRVYFRNFFIYSSLSLVSVNVARVSYDRFTKTVVDKYFPNATVQQMEAAAGEIPMVYANAAPHPMPLHVANWQNQQHLAQPQYPHQYQAYAQQQ